MALSTTNCYVPRVDAEAYFADRLDTIAWDEATDVRKDQSLITATGLLDELQWSGVAVSEDQPLAFPRSGSYFDPRLGYETTFPVTIPPQILIATIELALHLLSNEGLLDQTGQVDDLLVGPISLTSIKNPSVIPSTVRRKIRPLLLNGGSRTWWRAW